jgi:hypothetical protein
VEENTMRNLCTSWKIVVIILMIVLVSGGAGQIAPVTEKTAQLTGKEEKVQQDLKPMEGKLDLTLKVSLGLALPEEQELFAAYK